MANPVWPASLPQYVLQTGYGEEKQDQGLRTPMEGGAVKTRRRFTARFDQVSVRLLCTNEQIDTFETFYDTTTAGGTLPFDWVHPRRRDVRTMQIVGKPQISAAEGGDNFYLSLKLELKP